MIRLMQPGDLPAMEALWQEAFGPDDQAKEIIEKFAGVTHAWVNERDGQIAGMLLAPPAQIDTHKGVYLCGLATAQSWRGKGVATELLQQVTDLLKQVGVEFAALIPENDDLYGFYEKRGYQQAFARRVLEKPLHRNLWSRAEFDTVPVRAVSELRKQFCPQMLQVSAEAVAWTVSDLYRRGITMVSNENGYGLYFREEDCLRFVELMAKNDKAVQCLLEAAREKEVVAERAVFSVPAGGCLFMGEGVRQPHGMIRFLAQPFDLEESYLGLALDV